MIRTFLAVELSEAVRNAIASFQDTLKRRLQKDSSREVRISWVQPASMHLTIKFLGDTDERLVEPLHEAVSQAVATHRSAALPIERASVADDRSSFDASACCGPPLAEVNRFPRKYAFARNPSSKYPPPIRLCV